MKVYCILFFIIYIIEQYLCELSSPYTTFLLYSIIQLSVFSSSYNYHSIINSIICIIYLVLLRGNIESLFNGIILNNIIKSQQPTPHYIIKEINNLILLYTSDKIKKIIDFGCGDCNTLNNIDFNYEKIGIDYNKDIYENAIYQIKKNNYQIDEIININILEYNFNTNFLLYMYEPLWEVEDTGVYKTLFLKLSKLDYDIDIIYLTGLTSKKLDKYFFNKYNFHVIKKIDIGSIFLNRSLYYCRKSN